MSIEFSIIFYSTIAGFSTILGIILVHLNNEWVIKHSHFINSFAAGLILGIAFFHLFPESIELSENALSFILLGFLLFYVLENVMVIHSGAEVHFKEGTNPQHTKGLVMFTGLFFHSLLDGIIIGVGFEIDPKVGILTSLGVILHEFPEGVTTFSILLGSIKKATALKLSVAVGLATPVGAILSLTFLNALSDGAIGILLAMAGGSFLYISASDLIPETHKEKGYQNTVFLLLGVFFLFIISNTLGA